MIGRAGGLGGSLVEGRFLKNARIKMVGTSQMRKNTIYSWSSAIYFNKALDGEEGNERFL